MSAYDYDKDHVTQREKILKSEHGQKMIRYVSPIYDESYVMCWIYEAIGREMDKLSVWIDELMLQAIPSSATWTLGYWEQELGIVSSASATDAERKLEILNHLIMHKPATPYRIEYYLTQMVGRTCHVVENIAPYTFLVHFDDGDAPVNYDAVKAYIDGLKQTHHAYELGIDSHAKIVIKPKIERFVYDYYAMCGELPDISTYGGVGRATIEIDPERVMGISRYVMSGQEQTGTKPGISTYGGVLDADVEILPNSAGNITPYEMTDTAETGTVPGINIYAGLGDATAMMDPELQGTISSYQLASTAQCGEKPYINIHGVDERIPDVSMETNGIGHVAQAAYCGDNLCGGGGF